MTSQSSPEETNETEKPSNSAPSEGALSGHIQPPYNTVFERILHRMDGENGIPLVVACVAYSLYKNEKREWIVSHQLTSGDKPTQAELDFYVSGITNLRLDSIIVQAQAIIREFGAAVVESARFEINDQIYRSQFQSLHDTLGSQQDVRDERHTAVLGHVTNRTRMRWMPGIWQALAANFIWTFIVVVFLVSLNFGFDFNNFPGRIRAFFNPPPAASTPSTPATPDGGAPPPSS